MLRNSPAPDRSRHSCPQRACALATLTAWLALASVLSVTAAPATLEEVLQRWRGKSPTELRAAAEAGNAEAQHSFAYSLLNATNAAPAQQAEALQWMQRAADQKLAVAQAGLGAVYLEGRIVTADVPVALKWLRAAAEQGLPYAQNYLGLVYANGWGVPANATEAVRWYQAAATNNYPWAWLNLGKMTLLGLGGLAANKDAGLKLIQQAADTGDGEAQTELGLVLNLGLGVPADPAAALTWFRKASDQGYAPGMVHLANAYALGTDGPPDLPAALALYRKAADKGNAAAAFALAELYAGGEGSPRDATDATNALYERAAEANVFRAAERLAERLRWGYAGTPDRLKACGWYCRAAARMGSRNIFGLITREGGLIPQPDEDTRQFARLFQTHRRACQDRDPAALMQMGRWCLEGTVGPVDLIEAFKWFSVAGSQGDATAQAELAKLRPRLTPEQLKIAERRLVIMDR